MNALRIISTIYGIMIVSSCDVPVGYEKELADSKVWPQTISGSLYIVDAGSFNGDYAEWAIGHLEIPGKEESISLEFKGEVLKEAGISLEFELPDSLTVEINPPIERYFQVIRVIK